MKNEEIKTLLNQLNNDLNEPKSVITWQLSEYQPMETRLNRIKTLKKSTMISNIIYIVATILLAAFGVFTGVALLVLCVAITAAVLMSLIGLYRKVIPNVLKTETITLDYYLDFNKKVFQIKHGYIPLKSIKFHQANIRLPALPLPQDEQNKYANLRAQIYQKIQNQTGLTFEA